VCCAVSLPLQFQQNTHFSHTLVHVSVIKSSPDKANAPVYCRAVDSLVIVVVAVVLHEQLARVLLYTRFMALDDVHGAFNKH
jgi:hypothetical protein